jgi:ABC-2 type transport system permease protein
MLHLIKKELTANVRYMLIGILGFIVYMFIVATTGPGPFMICIVFCFYTISSTNLILDERYKIELLLSTLPIKRRDIVLSKFLMIIVIFVGCFVLYSLLAFVSRTLGYDKVPPLNRLSASIGLMTISLFNGVTLPLAYKFGAQATRYVSFILFFGVFFLSGFIGKLDLSAVGGFLQNLSELQLSLLIVVLAVIINVVSYMFSESIYAKKDFK